MADTDLSCCVPARTMIVRDALETIVRHSVEYSRRDKHHVYLRRLGITQEQRKAAADPMLWLAHDLILEDTATDDRARWVELLTEGLDAEGFRVDRFSHNAP
jgi:hypothetical protein